MARVVRLGARPAVKRPLTNVMRPGAPKPKRRPPSRSLSLSSTVSRTPPPNPLPNAGVRVNLVEQLKLYKAREGIRPITSLPDPNEELEEAEDSDDDVVLIEYEENNDEFPKSIEVDILQLKHSMMIANTRAYIDVFYCSHKGASYTSIKKLKSFEFPLNSSPTGDSSVRINVPLNVDSSRRNGPLKFFFVTKVRFMQPKVMHGEKVRTRRASLESQSAARVWTNVEVMYGCDRLVTLNEDDTFSYNNKPGLPLVSCDVIDDANWMKSPTFLDKLITLSRKESIKGADQAFLIYDHTETEEDKKKREKPPKKKYTRKSKREMSLPPVVPDIPDNNTSFWVFREQNHLNEYIPEHIIYRFVVEDQQTKEVLVDLLRDGFVTRVVPCTDDRTVSVLTDHADKCLFCDEKFDCMSALLKHLRLTYPRLWFFYKMLHKTLDWPVIEVSLNDEIDEVSADPPIGAVDDSLGMIQYLSIADSSMLAEQKTRPMCVHPTTLALLYETPENIHNAKFEDLHSDWLKEKSFMDIDRIEDLTEESKKYFKVWWSFYSQEIKECGPFPYAHYSTMRRFLSSNREALANENLFGEWLRHLTRYAERDLLNQDDVYDLTQRFWNPAYDPSQDSLSMIKRPFKPDRSERYQRVKYMSLYEQ